MRIGILGTGDVGRALGTGFLTLGHEVLLGSRDATNARAHAWAKEHGDRASVGTFAEAAEYAELAIVATLGSATEAVLDTAGPHRFEGKIVLDTTNPLDGSQGFPPTLFVGMTDSLGERIQRKLEGADVVKAFNTVGNTLMFRPKLEGGPPDMFVAGNSDRAKGHVRELLGDFGWGMVDLGDIEASRCLEPMCLVWVLYGARTNTWGHAFKLLRK